MSTLYPVIHSISSTYTLHKLFHPLKYQFQLLDWDYMDFQTTVNINTNIYTIHKLIQSKHGRVKDVKLYKDAIVKEENELLCGHDDDNGMNNTGWSGSKTLKEWGVEGGVIKEDAPVLSICYDFKPLNANHDPILLSWMG